jgi:hypothetical protein
MARIRSIHPGIWTDEQFVSVSAFARLLALGLWNEADDQGVFEWKPITLKLRLLPADSVDVAALLAELVTIGNLMRYEVDGKPYGAIRNFRKFQRPEKPNAIHPLGEGVRKWVGLDSTAHTGSAKKPPPVGGESGKGGAEHTTTGHTGKPNGRQPSADLSQTTPPPFADQSPTTPRLVGQMEEEGEEKEEGEESSSLRSPRAREAASDFETWWKLYPRRVSRPDAAKAYARAVKAGTTPETLAQGVRQFAFDGNPRFIPHPATWLNRERWKDEPPPPQPQPGRKPFRNGFMECAYEDWRQDRDSHDVIPFPQVAHGTH